jgi:hypothetical protein
MIQEEIVAKAEVATQIEAAVGVECKTCLFTACSMKETLTIRREIVPFSWNQKRT